MYVDESNWRLAGVLTVLAIAGDLLNSFKMMSQYASAAYCSNNFDSPGDQVECGSGNCPIVQEADTNTLIEYTR
jgi:hypothetical protein